MLPKIQQAPESASLCGLLGRTWLMSSQGATSPEAFHWELRNGHFLFTGSCRLRTGLQTKRVFILQTREDTYRLPHNSKNIGEITTRRAWPPRQNTSTFLLSGLLPPRGSSNTTRLFPQHSLGSIGLTCSPSKPRPGPLQSP